MTNTTARRRRPWRRRILFLILALLLLCLAGAGTVYLQNRSRPTASVDPDHLSEHDAALAAEFFQLRAAVGDDVWPGWGQADAPLLLYNEANAFLIGYPEPPAGWARPPALTVNGGAWSRLPVEIAGRPVYRQPLPHGATPGAFTVKVGQRWAASMTTREWMGIVFADQIDEMVPPPLAPIFPYVPVTNLFLNSSDFYVAALAHESFHAFVGDTVPERLLAAEASLAAEAGYPWDDPASQAAWEMELDLLMAALRETDDAAAADAARDFLQQRAARRAAAGLSAAAVDLEREREWSEGLAKYVELALWQTAAAADDYRPVTALAGDPDFDAYQEFAARWDQEVAQIGRSGGQDGEGRFYYTGMAQAFLLDRFRPGWQAEALAPGVYLEDLLAEALG